jgi:hypothetical protein
VEVVVVGMIGLVEEVEGTIVVVVIMVQEVVVDTAEVMEDQEEDIIVMVVVAVMTTAVAVVVTGEETKRTTKGWKRILIMMVAMDKLPRKVLHPMAGLQVTTHHHQVHMEAVMHTVQILQCHPLTPMVVVVEALTHQATVPHLQTHIVVVPQAEQEACLLHMMVVMVAVLCLEVEAQVAHLHLIMAAVVVILEMLPLNQLRRLSSVMQTVMIPVIMQGFTSQTFLLM